MKEIPHAMMHQEIEELKSRIKDLEEKLDRAVNRLDDEIVDLNGRINDIESGQCS